MNTPSLGDIVGILDDYYPRHTAQSWDHVGLVVGDPAALVRRVMFCVDPTLSVITAAQKQKVDLLVSHHPLLFRPVSNLSAETWQGRSVSALMRGGIASYVAHTNADVATPGVNDALAAAAGITAPVGHPNWERAETFTFPEEQPLGRVGNLPKPIPLRELAENLADALPGAPVGIRVAGDPRALVQRIAVSGGSGDSYFSAAKQVDADVYITADLRHHPATDQRESVQHGRPFLIDAGHWASESLWLEYAGKRLTETANRRGWDISCFTSTMCTDPWNLLVPTLNRND